MWLERVGALRCFVGMTAAQMKRRSPHVTSESLLYGGGALVTG